MLALLSITSILHTLFFTTLMKYRLNDFDFDLPSELIANVPARPRDTARLLVYDRSSGQITDDYFYNIDRHLPSQTTIVVNNSKVEKCRFIFKGLEVFMLSKSDPYTCRALVKPGKKFKLGTAVQLADEISAEVLAIDEEGIRTLRFSVDFEHNVLNDYSHVALPPYIPQDDSLGPEYQTVYADPLGSKAAPTAGLHFTPELLDKLRSTHDYAEITLHVGMGTFAPIKDDDLSKVKLHEEFYSIGDNSADILNRAVHITAVGTTSVRTLESSIVSSPVRKFSACDFQSTSIFIHPEVSIRSVDALVTNFHIPKSSLLMLVSSFMGSVEEMQRVYAHAIDNKYRFYSFGDAMLIL